MSARYVNVERDVGEERLHKTYILRDNSHRRAQSTERSQLHEIINSQDDSRPRIQSTERIRRPGRILHGERSRVPHSDDEGGYYTFRGQHTREAYPTPANARNTTSNYYEGGLGREAWQRKFLERRRVPPPLSINTEERPPPPRPKLKPRYFHSGASKYTSNGMSSILCFVTIKGNPVFAEPAREFEMNGNNSDFALYLNEEYNYINARNRWWGFRYVHFKTIGAIEFQTVC
jgi:hypothetical protein